MSGPRLATSSADSSATSSMWESAAADSLPLAGIIERTAQRRGACGMTAGTERGEASWARTAVATMPESSQAMWICSDSWSATRWRGPFPRLSEISPAMSIMPPAPWRYSITRSRPRSGTARASVPGSATTWCGCGAVSAMPSISSWWSSRSICAVGRPSSSRPTVATEPEPYWAITRERPSLPWARWQPPAPSSARSATTSARAPSSSTRRVTTRVGSVSSTACSRVPSSLHSTKEGSGRSTAARRSTARPCPSDRRASSSMPRPRPVPLVE